MATPAHNANGYRRAQLTRRVKAEETHCALCDNLVDKSLRFLVGEHGPKCTDQHCTGCVPDPMRGEVDEDLPRSRGGSPLDRDNCHLMHRKCNQKKGRMTIAEARVALSFDDDADAEPLRPSPIW